MKDPGFMVIEDVFTPSECDEVLHCLAGRSVTRGRGGARNLMRIPEIRKLAFDKRLLRAGLEITGNRLTPYKATMFEKTGKANWLVAYHQDTALPLEGIIDLKGWGPSSRKAGVVFAHAPTEALSGILAIRVHLDASTAFNGPLRVIPASHHRRINPSEIRQVTVAAPEFQCLVGRGGVIAMSPLLVHASSKSKTDAPRRVLHIEYARSLDLAPGVRLAIA